MSCRRYSEDDKTPTAAPPSGDVSEDGVTAAFVVVVVAGVTTSNIANSEVVIEFVHVPTIASSPLVPAAPTVPLSSVVG